MLVLKAIDLVEGEIFWNATIKEYIVQTSSLPFWQISYYFAPEVWPFSKYSFPLCLIFNCDEVKMHWIVRNALKIRMNPTCWNTKDQTCLGSSVAHLNLCASPHQGLNGGNIVNTVNRHGVVKSFLFLQNKREKGSFIGFGFTFPQRINSPLCSIFQSCRLRSKVDLHSHTHSFQRETLRRTRS